MYVVINFLQNWLCFKFYQDFFFFFCKRAFCSFCQKISSAAVILDVSCSFSVQVLLPYSGMGIAMCCIFIVWFASGLLVVLELSWWFPLSVSIWLICYIFVSYISQCASQIIVHVYSFCYFVINYCLASDRVSSSGCLCFSFVDWYYYSIVWCYIVYLYTDLHEKVPDSAIFTW